MPITLGLRVKSKTKERSRLLFLIGALLPQSVFQGPTINRGSSAMEFGRRRRPRHPLLSTSNKSPFFSSYVSPCLFMSVRIHMPFFHFPPPSHSPPT